VIVLVLLAVVAPSGRAAEPSTSEILFSNVRVFDGRSASLSGQTIVLVRGNKIAAIGAGAAPAHPAVTIIDGGGRTLMPGLIDAHVHIMFATIPQLAVLTSDIGFVNVAAAKAANDMLLRGFTSIRDLGGPVFGLKQGIDAGIVAGPRIWPSGAFISQSGGHGDFRLPNDMPARATSPTASASAQPPSPTTRTPSASARANNSRSARRRSS
jgi:imidazolonepropionase-like amidohydrolase